MFLDFIAINKEVMHNIKHKLLYMCIIISVFFTGCGISTKSRKEDEYENEYIDMTIESEQYYSIYLLTDGRYLYEIYNKDGFVISREVLYNLPEITIYDSTYMEVKWGAGTGVWCCSYYDLEKCFTAGALICSHYVKDGIVALVVVGEDGERKLHLFNPFSYSEYEKNVDIKLAPELIRVNEADCLIEISVEDGNSIRVVYVNDIGEEDEVLLDIESLQIKNQAEINEL